MVEEFLMQDKGTKFGEQLNRHSAGISSVWTFLNLNWLFMETLQKVRFKSY